MRSAAARPATARSPARSRAKRCSESTSGRDGGRPQSAKSTRASGERLRVKQLLAFPGPLLSILQARRTFQAYLARLRARLESMLASEPLDVAGVAGQTNLIHRFLQRTASGGVPVLRQLPSVDALMADAADALAALSEFGARYASETTRLSATPDEVAALGKSLLKPSTGGGSAKGERKNGRKSKSRMSDKLFDRIEATATEAELEMLLTRFTEHATSASLFLGG